MVPIISHQDISCFLVNTQTRRKFELSISFALRSNLCDEGELSIEYLKSMIAGVSHVDSSSRLVDGNSKGILELCLVRSLAAEFGDKLNDICLPCNHNHQ